ncbi:MAG: HEAT repeat domain-containing protein [Leptospiraceae bacterium]|nr:HEAT repeat domain-containing protein [Leptospiraceae bacterium]
MQNQNTFRNLTVILFYLLLFCKGPDKPGILPVIQEEPMKTKDELLRDIKSNNWYERSQTIVEMAKTKDKTFLPEIRTLLKNDSNPAVRGSAALALGDFEDKISTPDIVKLFQSKDISTDTILDALTRMKDPTAANSIIPFLDSENHTYRLQSVDALATIGQINSGDKIISMASSNKDFEKAKTYAMVIGKLKLTKGESYLLSLAETAEPSPTLAATYLALGRIKSKKAIPVLAKAIGKDFEKGRENSVYALKEINDISANSFLIEYLKNKNREIQFMAADVISSLYDLKTAEKIVPFLDSSDKSLYAPTAQVLGIYKYEPARKKIEILAVDKTNPDREILTQSLGWLQNKESIPILKKILQEKEGEGRYGAAWSLGMLNAEDSIDLLQEAADGKDNKLTRISIESLGQIHSPKSLNFLTKKVESNKELSSVLLTSIASIPGEDASKILDKYALSNEIIIQKAALQAILQRKDQKNIPVLIQILEGNKSSEINSSAELALKAISGKTFSTRNEWINWFNKNK